MGEQRCVLHEHPPHERQFDERCREVERMLRERDPAEGFEWPEPCVEKYEELVAEPR
jgi:hypothetical protein